MIRPMSRSLSPSAIEPLVLLAICERRVAAQRFGSLRPNDLATRGCSGAYHRAADAAELASLSAHAIALSPGAVARAGPHPGWSLHLRACAAGGLVAGLVRFGAQRRARSAVAACICHAHFSREVIATTHAFAGGDQRATMAVTPMPPAVHTDTTPDVPGGRSSSCIARSISTRAPVAAKGWP